MFLDSSSGFNLGTYNPKMVVSLHSTLIHGSHIWTLPWSSVLSAYTDSDPVSQLALVHLREATPLFCSSPISGVCSMLLFRWCVYGSLCWPLLTSLASSCLCDQRNHQLAEHVHGGDAVRLRCGEKRALIYRLSSGPHPQGCCWFHNRYTRTCNCRDYSDGIWSRVSVQDDLGPFCFLIFVAYTISSGAFLLGFVPETKGRTMVEITQDFDRLNYKNSAPLTSPTYCSTTF